MKRKKCCTDRLSLSSNGGKRSEQGNRLANSAGLGDDARNPDPGDAGYRPEVFDAMARLGWLGWRVPAALGGSEGECERMQRVYEHFLARQRQFAAVLEAHGIPVLHVHCNGTQDARTLL